MPNDHPIRTQYLVLRYSTALLHRYLDLFHQYSDHLHRITDTVRVEDGRLRRSLTLDLTMPTDKVAEGQEPPPRESRSLIYLMRGERGQLFDNLDVRDASGRSLSVLSQDENKDLASLLLQTQYSAALQRATINADRLDYAYRLGQFISSIPLMTIAGARRTFDRYLRTAEPMAELGITGVDYERLRRLANFLCDRFLVSAEVECGPLDKALVKYSFDTRYREGKEHVDQGSGVTWRESARRALGQTPYSFRFRIPLAFASQSYHFRMDAPARAYCHWQKVLVEDDDPAPGSGTRTRLKEYVPDSRKIQYRTTDAVPNTYSHIYLHGMNRLDRFPLYARVIFYEIPPGSLGVASIVSLLTSLTLVLVAFFSGVLLSGKSDQAAAIVALVVALPGTMAFWLQPTLDRADLLSAPILSRAGLILSGTLAYLSSLLLLIVQPLTPMGFGGLVAVWAILALFAAGNLSASVYLTMRWHRGVKDLEALR